LITATPEGVTVTFWKCSYLRSGAGANGAVFAAALPSLLAAPDEGSWEGDPSLTVGAAAVDWRARRKVSRFIVVV
jgi:hypothetical protein